MKRFKGQSISRSWSLKQALEKLFRSVAVRVFIFIYLITFTIQLFHDVQIATRLLFGGLITFTLILLVIRLTEGMKVEVVPVNKPLIMGVFAGLLIAGLWILAYLLGRLWTT